jgi:hypothetical protein
MHIWKVVRPILEESERRERRFLHKLQQLSSLTVLQDIWLYSPPWSSSSPFLSSPIERASGYNQIVELNAQNESSIEKHYEVRRPS